MSEADRQRYIAAAHAMQTGVATVMNWDSGPTSPKHLRVGVNSAMCDHGALVGLLISKGVFTEEEYLAAIADMMEREAERYRQQVQDHYGPDGPTITLG